MADYDGDIQLSMSLDPKDVKAASKSLQDDIKQIFNQSAGKELDTKFKKLETSMSKAASKAQTLQEKIKKLEDTPVPTSEYNEIQKQIDAASNSLSKLQERQQRFLETGGKASSSTYKRMEYDIQQLENTIKYAKAELQDLVDTGKAFTLGSDTAQYQSAVQQLADVNNQMRVLVTQADDGSKGMEDLGKSTKSTNRIFSTFKSVLQGAGRGLANVAKKLWDIISSAVKSGLQRLSGAIKGLAGSSNAADFSMKKLFWNMMKYGLGIRSLYALVKKLRSAITEGINNLSQFNGGANRTNAAMTQLTSSLTYLKNAWGAAFAPILSYVAPVLSRLISMIAAAINAIARLFAALTGQKTVMQAKYKSQDYAAGLSGGGSSGSNKKSAEEKYEEAVKKAQEKYEKKLADVREKNAKKVAKAEEKQAKAAEKLAKKQEEANQQLGDYDKLNVIAIEQEEELEDYTPDLLEEPELEEVNFDDFVDAAGGAADAIADMFEEVPVELTDWMKEIKDAIENGEWYKLGGLIAEKLNEGMKVLDDWINNTFRPMGKKIASIAAEIGNGFVDGFDWKLLGKTVADGLNAIADIVNTFLTEFNFENLGKGIGEAIKSWFDNIEWDLMGQVFANKWNALIDLIYGIVTTPGLWDSIGESIATFVNNWFDTIDWKKLGETTAASVNGVIEAIDKAINETKWENIGKDISDGLTTSIEEIKWDELGKTFSDGFKGVLKVTASIDWGQIALDLGAGLAQTITNIDWGTLATALGLQFQVWLHSSLAFLVETAGELAQGFADLFEDLGMEGMAGFWQGIANGLKDAATWLKENMVDPIVKQVKDLLGIHSPSKVFEDIGKNIVEGLKQGIINAWTSLKTAVQTKIDNLKQQFEDAWNNIKEKAFLLWDTIKNGVSERVENMKNSIKEKIDEVKQHLNDASVTIQNIVSTLKNAVENTLQNMWGFIKNIINNVIGGVERMVNSVIDAINGMIDAVKSLPAVGELAGLVIDNIPNISLPRLAQGAVIPPNQEFLAVLGDQKSGTNVEAPLSTIMEAMNKVLDARGGGNNEPIVLQLDGEVIAQVVWDEEEKRYKQRGDYQPLYT